MIGFIRMVSFAGLLGLAAVHGGDGPGIWRKLDEGLYVGEFDAPQKSHRGDSRITVVRVDPEHFAFRVLSAVREDSVRRTVKEWCERHELVGAINAGMYAKDYLTHVGYMKNDGRVLNPSVRKDYRAAFVCDPDTTGIASAALVDFECRDFAAVDRRYRTVVQNLRMISCKRTNVWSRRKRRWSTAALGADDDGFLLFVFCQSPYSVHDLNDMLLELPINLSNAMYLEGGAPASFYLSHNGTTIERYGFFETDGKEGGGLVIEHRLPNVIGFTPR
ncbi:MAG: hypothetical protein GF344_07635 [Chitinivibrionales bacterium]|nr:hypothetical protein [Chitinivibrionales bacterium]MBD3356770.1 hypothetical protein [Chitinivibrionales bacterium]